MSTSLSDRLDAALAKLRTDGCIPRELGADATAIEQIIREGGDSALLMDCDRARDVAWYKGEVELRAMPEPGVCIYFERDGRPETLEIATTDAPGRQRNAA